MKFKSVVAIGIISIVAMASGCGLKESNELEATVTPTPATVLTAQATATPVPVATATPVPVATATPTPVPTLTIGEKTEDASMVAVKNDMGTAIKEIFVATGGSYQWGENLLNDKTLAAGASGDLYYDVSQAGDYGYYDIKLVMEGGEEYYTMSLALADMKDMEFYINDEDQDSWVRYTSVADGEKKDTRDDWVEGSIADTATTDTATTDTANTEETYSDYTETYDAVYEDTSYEDTSYDDTAYYDTYSEYDNTYDSYNNTYEEVYEDTYGY